MVRKKSESTADLVCDPEYIPVCVCVCLQEMSQSQRSLEKTALQKCLLHYESLHGRPVSLH